MLLTQMQAYQKINPNGWTFSTPIGVVELDDGNKVTFLVPYGEGYDCDEGHFIKIMTKEEFLKEYSLTYIPH